MKSQRKKYTYVRICASCGDSKEVGYIPKKDTLCKQCSCLMLAKKMQKINTIEDGKYKVYSRVCSLHGCDDVRHDLKAKPQEPQLCKHCSLRVNKKRDKVQQVIDAKEVIKLNGKYLFLRVCKTCEEGEYITSKPQRPTNCKKCLLEANQVKRDNAPPKAKYIPKVKKKKPKVKNQPPPEAIEKIREINRVHHEAVAKRPKKIVQTISDEDMMAKFLENNKPSVEFNNEPMPHLFSGGLGSNTSVMSGV